MERIIVKRLQKYLINKGILDRYQSGFTPNKSTSDNLLRLTQEITDGFISNEYTICVFFDVGKAFDRISHTAITSKLQTLGIRGNMYAFLEDFLLKLII